MLSCDVWPLCVGTTFFFFNDTATTEIYTLSLHDALPISGPRFRHRFFLHRPPDQPDQQPRSEEHTSELQSPCNLVCRLLLEKKNIYGRDSPSTHISHMYCCPALSRTG